MHSTHPRRPVAILAAALMVISACSAAQNPSPGDGDAGSEPANPAESSGAGGPVPGGTLTIGWNVEPTTMLAYQGVVQADVIVGQHVYETLVTWDEVAGAYAPGLAESWEMSSDGTEWTLSLKDGVTFHDGTEFNAAAVQANFDWIGGDVAEGISPFTRNFVTGYVETRVEDELTAVVVFDAPNPGLLDGLAHPGLAMASPDSLATGEPVGSGPYMFKEWVRGSQIVLERNPDYDWGAPTRPNGPYLDELVFRIIVEEGTRAAALEGGEVGIAFLGYADYPRFAANDQFRTEAYVRPGTVRGLHFNALEEGPMQDVRVRQAVSHAIDRDALAGAPFFGGAAITALSPLSPTTPGYNETVDAELEALALNYDPQRAGELLDEAGWVMGESGYREKDGERLSLRWPAPQAFFVSRVAELVQDQLRDVGIEARIEVVPDFAALTPIRNAGDYDVIIGGSFQAYMGVLMATYDARQIGQGFIWSRHDDAELVELLVSASQELDPAERANFWRSAMERIMETNIMTPLYVEPYTFGMRKDLEGLRFSAGGEPQFYEAYFAEGQ